MVSTLKVNKIQIPNSDSDVISLDASSGNITIPKNITFNGTVTGDNNGMVLLQTVTASDVSSVNIGSSTLITTDYSIYQIHCINIHPANDGVEFRCRMSKGGSIITGSEYEYSRNQHIHSSSFTNRGSNSDGIVNLAESVGGQADEHVSQIHTLYNPAETTFKKLVNFKSASVDLSPNIANNDGVYAHEGNTAAIDGMEYFFASGNISTGTFKLYGIK